LLKDDTIVCYHDETLQRLHNDHRFLEELEYEDIKYYNIPLFDNIMFELGKNSNIIIDVEIKVYSNMSNDRLKYFCKLLLEKIDNSNIKNKIIISSFSEDIINIMLDNKTKYDICFLTYDIINLKTIIKMIDNGLLYIGFDKNKYNILNRYLTLSLNLIIYTLFDGNNEIDELILSDIKTNNISNIYIVTDNINDTLQLLKL